MAKKAQLRVGCSGWMYRHWRGNFYPEDLPQSRWLEFYASRFDTVEVNNSFYRLPEKATFANWALKAPRGFLFAVKASRYLTHMKKLKEPAEAIDRLFGRARALASHLGPVLYQLPPRWALDLERLDRFLDLIPKRVPQAVEFRDPSWYADEAYETLTRHRVALCVHDMEGSASGQVAVGPFIYARFHGAGARYGGSYPDAVLEQWASWLREQRSAGKSIYAYFNNDVGGHAPRDAVRLLRLLER